jgi:hypothetical protein
MRCDFCDEPAVVHMTNVDAKSGRKTETHVCLRHAGRTGLPPDSIQDMSEKMESTRRAIKALQTFVAAERRVPSLDELRAIGVADAMLPDDPNDPLFHVTLEQLGAMARMMLEESGQAPE